MHQKKQLTLQEREAIAAKYQRRIIELGTPIFGPPEDGAFSSNVVPFPNPKADELLSRILEASKQLLEAAPPLDEEPPAHRKPGDLVRTAERLRAGEVDLPDPTLDREEVADSLESHAEFERAKLAFGEEMDAITLEALAGLEPILHAVVNFALDVFHEVKRWAEEDPEGPGADLYRDLNRARRQGAGRSRGRKGGRDSIRA